MKSWKTDSSSLVELEDKTYFPIILYLNFPFNLDLPFPHQKHSVPDVKDPSSPAYGVLSHS